jgi:hypothetical protein
VTYSPAADHREYDNISRLLIFPVRNANSAKIENQFSWALLEMFIQILP